MHQRVTQALGGDGEETVDVLVLLLGLVLESLSPRVLESLMMVDATNAHAKSCAPGTPPSCSQCGAKVGFYTSMKGRGCVGEVVGRME